MEIRKIRLIGLSGKLQSGKDTVAGIIQDLMPGYWITKRFAGKLKQMTSLATGIPVEDLENIAVKNSSLGPEWNDMTVRTFLQKLGTEAARDVIHPNFWLNALMADWVPDLQYMNSPRYPNNWIVTDVRFENEARLIQEKGGIVIRINRKGKENTGNHPSETSLDNYTDWNHVIQNDGDLVDLYGKVEDILQPIIYSTTI